MAKRKPYNQENKKDFTRTNDQIRVPRILLVKDGQKLGEFKTRKALQMARDAGLDLVEVSPNSKPPVCSIMDYGKYQYNKQKKSKQQSSGRKEKEVSFRYVIDDHDLQTKANQVRKFIEKGMRVKLVVKFKSREKAHKNQGFEAVNKLIKMVEDVVLVEKAPSMEGNNIIARLDKAKNG